jgi:hypothetical protein
MSDDTAAPAPRPPVAGIWENYCQHPGCTKWGGFGYARGKGEYDWFCWEYRPEEKRA